MQTSLATYEVTFILGEKASQEAAIAKATELTTYVAEHGGSVTRQELWGRRELAYAIKRNRSGFYVTLWIEFPKQEITAFEQHLMFDEGVIRSLVTKAYTSAQEGSLYPVVEEEKERRPRGDKATAEEQLRRTTRPSKKKEDGETDAEGEELPEEERLKQLDAAVDGLLKEDEAPEVEAPAAEAEAEPAGEDAE